uniref:IntlP n=1 Tax=Penaeus japonicus TaxID=27405 RepID=Q4VRA7_PENJP|nr:IntlP [Penaeus japonicus]
MRRKPSGRLKVRRCFLMPSEKMLHSSLKLLTERGWQLFMLRSRKGWTTSWRPPMSKLALSRSTW